MTAKILVADDSQTIQKVVSMTLAGHDFILTECRDLDQLKKLLGKETYDLILLDYNLSNESSGAEILKSVREMTAQTPIVLMVGIFDNLDDSDLDGFGVSEKLVKPFNNQKLIQICHQYASSEGENPFVQDKTSEEETTFEEPEEDVSQWVVDSSQFAIEEDEEISTNEEDNAQQASEQSFLAEELQGWGIDIPHVIDAKENLRQIEVPGVIEELEDSQQDYENQDFEGYHDDDEEEIVLPEEEDLSYPDLENRQPKSHFISLDELEQDDDSDDQEDDDSTDPEIDLSGSFRSPLQEEIEAEISPDEFWAAEDANLSEATQSSATLAGSSAAPHISRALEEDSVVTSVWDTPEPNVSDSSHGLTLEKPQINEAQLVELLKKEMTPIIEKWLKDSYQETIERVAWEIIPDLAENLIRNEIHSIAQKVKENHLK